MDAHAEFEDAPTLGPSAATGEDGSRDRAPARTWCGINARPPPAWLRGRILAIQFASAIVVGVLLVGGAGPGTSSQHGSSPNAALVRPDPPNALRNAASPEAGLTSSVTVPLVPEPTGTPTSCVVGGASNRYNSSADGYFALDANLYGFKSNYTGSTNLCYYASNGTLSERMDFATPGGKANGILGYPEAILGQNIYGGVAGIENPDLPLPDYPVANITDGDLWASLNYSVTAPANATPYNFAFDDWLTPTPANSTVTTHVGDKIEVMVWFANDKGSWLPQTEFNVSTFLNGQSVPGTWYRDDWCGDKNTTLTFDYLYSENGSSPGYGVTAGQLAVNLSYIFANVANLTAQGLCWAAPGTSIASYYTDAFAIGAEFYPETSEHAVVNWTVTRYCYTFVAGAPTGPGVDCTASTQTKSPSPLVAGGSSNVTGGVAPLTVGYSGQVSGGEPPYAYYWRFGEGNASSPDLDAAYTYSAPGVYVANFSVADVDSIATSENLTILVESSAKFSLTVRSSSESPLEGTTVEFTADPSGGKPPYTFAWSGLPSGPGCASVNQSSLNCTVESSGSYTVAAEVTDGAGRVASGSTLVTISGTTTTSSHHASSQGGWGALVDPLVGAATVLLLAALVVWAVLRSRRRRRERSGPGAEDPPRAGAPDPPAT